MNDLGLIYRIINESLIKKIKEKLSNSIKKYSKNNKIRILDFNLTINLDIELEYIRDCYNAL